MPCVPHGWMVAFTSTSVPTGVRFSVMLKIVFLPCSKVRSASTGHVNTVPPVRVSSKLLPLAPSCGRMMAEAGCADGEVVKVSLPLAPGSRDDVVFAGLNGVSFYFMRGTVCEMPTAVVEILKNCGEM